MAAEWEISSGELEQKIAEGYQLIDIRDAQNVAYGMIPGAINMAQENLPDYAGELSHKKGAVIYCTRCRFSKDAVETLRELGVQAYSLRGGYMGWLMDQMEKEKHGISVFFLLLQKRSGHMSL